jgi:hypothetical protein
MKFRTILLVIILFVLIGAAGFIGWQIYIGSQAPEDATAQPGSDGCDCSIVGCGNGCWEWNCNSNCDPNNHNFQVYLWHCPNIPGNDAACDFCGPENGGQLINTSNALSGQMTVDTCGLSQLDIGYDLAPNGIISGSCFGFASTCGGDPPPPEDPFCGDGNVDPGEECDPPGSTVGDQICDENCRLQDIPPEPFCGDGNVDPGEECDPPGSTVGDQTCDENCQLQDIPVDPFCGDGNIDDGEQCGEPGLTCPAGNTCNTAQCICEPDDSDCGDPCTTDTDCPNDHVCSDGTCQLPTCVNNPDSCTPNGCGIVELPKTDLESEEIQSILIGVVLMMIGILVYRSESFQRFFRSYMGDIADDNFLSVLKGKDNSAQTHGEKVLEKFENER